MLISISEGDIFREHPELKNVPEFKALSSTELKYVMLLYDYESIYRKLPIADRKHKVAKHLKIISGSTPTASEKRIVELEEKRMQDAVTVFLSMQFDEDRETLNALTEQIRQYRTFLSQAKTDPDDLKVAKDIQKAMVDAVELKKQLLTILGYRSEEVEDNEQGLTAIDRWVKNNR